MLPCHIRSFTPTCQLMVRKRGESEGPASVHVLTHLYLSSLVSSACVSSSSCLAVTCSPTMSLISAFTSCSLANSCTENQAETSGLGPLWFCLKSNNPRMSHPTLFSFFVLSSTSCCREEKVSLISNVSSSCSTICCWISLSRLICQQQIKLSIECDFQWGDDKKVSIPVLQFLVS